MTALLFGFFWVLVVLVGGAYIAACLLVMAATYITRLFGKERP